MTFFLFLFFISGNKVDREDREIPTSIGEEFSRLNHMYFIETSAKECDNVDKLFHEIARDLIQVLHQFSFFFVLRKGSTSGSTFMHLLTLQYRASKLLGNKAKSRAN